MLGAGAVGDEAPADVLQAGDRVAVGHHPVGDEPHHAQTGFGLVEPGDAAVGLEADPATLDVEVVVLDEAA